MGVIFYQMLFGRRPFGHEQSQEQILRNEVGGRGGAGGSSCARQVAQVVPATRLLGVHCGEPDVAGRWCKFWCGLGLMHCTSMA